MQSVAMRIIYKGVFHWFLKLIVGVQFTDCQFLKKEKQFVNQPLGYPQFAIFFAR